jgi:signal transduction histidine kinase
VNVKRKDLILFFLLPFAGVLAIFLAFSLFNRATIQRKTEALVHEQLLAAARILDVNISHFLGEGMTPADVLALYSGEENIYYMALLDGRKNILAWTSRYEGYLPFSADDARRSEPWVIDSPAGRIFNLMSTFRAEDGTTGFLYLGYSLASLGEMIARSKRNFLIMFAFLSAGGVVFFIGLFILQRRYLAKALEAESEREEKERFREISAFTSSVAHEIKNPLNSLSLLFDLLQKKSPAELKGDAALGKAEVRKISQVIDTFSNHLKATRPAGERIALRDVVAAARQSVPGESVAAGVAFRFSEPSLVTINVDRDLFTRCLGNILRNAFEATAEGAVSVTAKKGRRKTLILVADTGRGMAPDDLERAFDPFFSTKKKGMGIGLYLAKRIVEAHGGKIWASSEAGRGTTFYLQIPGEDHE